MRIKKLFAVLLVIAVTLSLVACGGGKVDPNDPNQGLWVAVNGEMMGFEMGVEEVFGEGFTIELQEKGKCTLMVDGKKANGTWTLDNGAFTVKGGGLDSKGRLENGVLQLEDVMGMGLNLLFFKNGELPTYDSSDDFVDDSYNEYNPDDYGDSYESYVPDDDTGNNVDDIAPANTLSDGYAWWDGQWYGEYYILEGAGGFSEFDGYYGDCSAFVDMKTDGTGTLYLWDDYEELATLEVAVDLAYGGGTMGELAVVSGTLFGVEAEEGHFYVDPTDEDYENFFYIYSDVRLSNDDYLRFEIYMRPWGMTWDGIDSEYIPGGYEGWYIEQGYIDYDSMLEALEETEIGGEPVFIHPGLPERAYSANTNGGGSSATGSGGGAASTGGAPAGGDGITSFSYAEITALRDKFYEYDYDTMCTYTYEMFRDEFFGGIEGEQSPNPFPGRWQYYWYSTESGNYCYIVFNAETGLYYSDSLVTGG